MQKDYIAVFYLQKNYVKFDIFRTLTTSRLSILTEIPFTTINVKGSILIRHMSLKIVVSNVDFNFPKINFLVIEQYGCHATMWSLKVRIIQIKHITHSPSM